MAHLLKASWSTSIPAFSVDQVRLPQFSWPMSYFKKQDNYMISKVGHFELLLMNFDQFLSIFSIPWVHKRNAIIEACCASNVFVFIPQV